jgi:serralysin
MSAVVPTDLEQYMLELVNRARANPAFEAARYNIDLNEGLPAGTITPDAKQPLAINPYVTDGARKHSQWMLDNDTFAHAGAGGSSPGQRMASAGYAAAGSFGWGENIAYRGSRPGTPPPVSTTAMEHEDLFVDEGIDGRGHRTNLMKPDFKEVGVGVVTGEFKTYNAVMSTQDFGYRNNVTFLTGVAFDDAAVKADNFYTPGEGLGGVTVTAVRSADGKNYSATTWSTGGYVAGERDDRVEEREAGRPADGGGVAHADPDPNALADPHADAGPDTYTDANTGAHTDADSEPDAYTHARPDPHADAGAGA